VSVHRKVGTLPRGTVIMHRGLGPGFVEGGDIADLVMIDFIDYTAWLQVDDEVIPIRTPDRTRRPIGELPIGSLIRVNCASAIVGETRDHFVGPMVDVHYRATPIPIPRRVDDVVTFIGDFFEKPADGWKIRRKRVPAWREVAARRFE